MVALVRKYLPDAQFSVPPVACNFTSNSASLKAIWVYDWLSGNNIQVADTGNYTLDTAATSDFIVLGFANTDVNECETVLERLSHTVFRPRQDLISRYDYLTFHQRSYDLPCYQSDTGNIHYVIVATVCSGLMNLVT